MSIADWGGIFCIHMCVKYVCIWYVPLDIPIDIPSDEECVQDSGSEDNGLGSVDDDDDDEHATLHFDSGEL